MEQHYVGIDLHCNNNYVVITDGMGEICLEERVRNELSSVVAVLAPYRESIRGVALESTYNWYWLGDGLKEAGYPMVALNLLAPVTHHFRLLRVVRPFRHGGTNFLHDGLGPTAFHQGGLGAGTKVGQ